MPCPSITFMEEKTMATKKENTEAVNETPEVTPEVTPKDDGRVDLTIPRGTANDEPYVIIGHNGKNYQLPRGKTSRVPKYIKDEWDRSVRAQERYDDTMDRLLEQKNNPKSLD